MPMVEYTCLRIQVFERGPYRLEPLREADLPAIKDWRNAQIDILRQAAPLTDADQARYYRQVVAPLFAQARPSQVLFSFLRDGHCIGYGGLVYLDWSHLRSEISFLVEPGRAQDERAYVEDFSNYLQLIEAVAFRDLGLNRLYTETFDIRPTHIGVLEANGFEFEGRMKQHVKIGDQFVDSVIHGCLRNDDEE